MNRKVLVGVSKVTATVWGPFNPYLMTVHENGTFPPIKFKYTLPAKVSSPPSMNITLSE